jgi:AcrR family transcriptional regulator
VTKAVPNATRRSERARQAILTAALDEVAEAGYAKLCIEGIAARAGVGKQTIYRWWPSKGAVVFDAVLSLGEDDASLPDTGDLAADLKTALRATVAELNDPRVAPALRALRTAITHDPQLAATYAERIDTPRCDARKQRLSTELTGDLDVAVDLLWGPLINRWLKGAEVTPEYADRIVEAALHGLLPRKDTPWNSTSS